MKNQKRYMMNKIRVWAFVLVLLVSACSKKEPGDIPLPVPPPVDTTTTPGKEDTLPAIPQLDDAVAAYMNKYNVPGLSLAVARNGKLVYAKGYGYADKETGEEVTTKSLFRLASVSKSFTAVTIMHLVEQHRLSLDDKVFGQDGILDTLGTEPYKQYVADITVSELLHHTGGGWGNSSHDPMFANLNYGVDQLISWTIDNRPLEHVPGSTFDYSNFGFFVLGRVVEKITGKPYEEYVHDSILAPIGVTDMRIGGNTLAERNPNEVVYYGQSGDNPYAWNVTRLGPAGGWTATPTDVVRFLLHIDGYLSPGILNQESAGSLITTSSANPLYACGLYISTNHNWWHSGSLPGTGTVMVRTPDGYCWAIFCNTKSYSETFFSDLTDGFIWKFVHDLNTPWPDVDLFK